MRVDVDTVEEYSACAGDALREGDVLGGTGAVAAVIAGVFAVTAAAVAAGAGRRG